MNAVRLRYCSKPASSAASSRCARRRAVPRPADAARGRPRLAVHPRRRGAGPGRRKRQRQDHAGAHAAGPHGAEQKARILYKGMDVAALPGEAARSFRREVQWCSRTLRRLAQSAPHHRPERRPAADTSTAGWTARAGARSRSMRCWSRSACGRASSATACRTRLSGGQRQHRVGIARALASESGADRGRRAGLRRSTVCVGADPQADVQPGARAASVSLHHPSDLGGAPWPTRCDGDAPGPGGGRQADADARC